MFYYTARQLAAQCIVIGPVCVCVCLWRAGGRCPNLTTASARAVFASLWALCFHCFLVMTCSVAIWRRSALVYNLGDSTRLSMRELLSEYRGYFCPTNWDRVLDPDWIFSRVQKPPERARDYVAVMQKPWPAVYLSSTKRRFGVWSSEAYAPIWRHITYCIRIRHRWDSCWKQHRCKNVFTFFIQGTFFYVF